MAIEKEDINDLTERYDARYAKKDDLTALREDIDHKLANDDKRIALLVHKVDFNNWLTAAIAVAMIGLVLKAFFGG